MDATIAIKVCAVCGVQQMGGESIRPIQLLSELGPLKLKAQDEEAFLRLPAHLRPLRCVYTHIISAAAGITEYYHLQCVRSAM